MAERSRIRVGARQRRVTLLRLTWSLEACANPSERIQTSRPDQNSLNK